jgi:pimeloyl-ACP methyl ester carboxylesterase
MTARITEFRNGPLTFPVRDSGPVDGDPVLLLHGWPQDGSSWDEVAVQLNAAGYRTFAPTLRGVAPTANPRGRRSFRTSLLVGDVAAMVGSIGQPVHLVGHDWGAALAWNVATARPDLVQSLSAVSVPHPGAFLKSLVTSSQGLSSWYMAFFQLPLVPELVLGWSSFMAFALRTTGQAPAAARRDAERNGTWALRRGGLNWYRGAVLQRDRGLVTPVPVLQVWSDGDTAVKRHAIDRTAEYARGRFRLEIFDGVSHWIPDEAPERLACSIIEHVEAVR